VTESITLTSGVASRYALALFTIGKEEKALERLEVDLTALKENVLNDHEFCKMITSPVYKRSEQQKAVLAISKKMKCSKNIQNVLGLMARKRRLFVLPAFIEDFRALMAVERGEVVAEVVSAKKLSKVEANRIEKEIKAALGKKIKLNEMVDEEVIGGLVIKVGSQMIDSTTKSKLLKLQKLMKEVD